MKRVIFHDLLTPEEALKKVEENFEVKPVGIEEVPLAQALSRVLAEDVMAEVDVPPFDRSTMDGYAVRARDTFGAMEERPVRLRVVDRVEAGRVSEKEVAEGEAMEIATGAPLPKGADAVVPVEYTKREGGYVLMFSSVSPGEYVSSAGSDIMLGELVLREGTVILERELGMLAAIGRSEVKVYRRPKVALISCGNELVSPGSELSYGMIYDVNTYSISSAVKSDGALCESLGIVRDDPLLIKEKLKEAERGSDVVIISGGTSAGLADLTYRALDELGPPGIIVHGLKVKPGKPTVIAISSNGKLMVGLPGYPNSALMIYDVMVRPIIRALAGYKEKGKVAIEARLAHKVEGARGRRGYYPVSLVVGREGKVMAYVMPAESGSVSSLGLSDGYVIVEEGKEFLDEGERVTVRLFTEEYRPAELYMVGSHDVAVEFILKKLDFRYKVVSVGSLEGIRAIARGHGDIAGIHLLDEATLEYNVPFLRKLRVTDALLVRGYMREQGIIVAKGNPKGILSVRDFLRDDVTMMNRNRGSGTRVLLDYLLKKELGSLKDVGSKVRGYYTEARTHSAVAAAVKYGRADAGLGIRRAAMAYGLDFISLGWESYDFLILRDSLGKGAVNDFLERLRSEEFERKLAEIPGYKPGEGMGEVVWEG
jgi:putative molybdopterin biosynthesis protein